MPFVKGKSGNVKGRPKLPDNIDDVRLAARLYTKDSLISLIRLAKSAKSEQVRCSASVALLDRGWGRPSQEVTGRGGGPIEVAVQSLPDLSHLSDEQLKVLHDIPGAFGSNGAAAGGPGKTEGGNPGGGSASQR